MLLTYLLHGCMPRRHSLSIREVLRLLLQDSGQRQQGTRSRQSRILQLLTQPLHQFRCDRRFLWLLRIECRCHQSTDSRRIPDLQSCCRQTVSLQTLLIEIMHQRLNSIAGIQPLNSPP